MDIERKKQQVVHLLNALAAGQREVVKSYLAEDCRIVFPGFNATGHEGVNVIYQQREAVFDGAPTKTYERWVVDDHAVAVNGVLRGRFKDGRVIDGTRYTDQFFFDSNGKITDWLVWNDLALIPAG